MADFSLFLSSSPQQNADRELRKVHHAREFRNHPPSWLKGSILQPLLLSCHTFVVSSCIANSFCVASSSCIVSSLSTLFTQLPQHWRQTICAKVLLSLAAPRDHSQRLTPPCSTLLPAHRCVYSRGTLLTPGRDPRPRLARTAHQSAGSRHSRSSPVSASSCSSTHDRYRHTASSTIMTSTLHMYISSCPQSSCSPQ